MVDRAVQTLLLALHGYTMNGAALRAALAPLQARLDSEIELLCPDAPVVCSPEAVARLMEQWGLRALPGQPHLTWWNASADGREYLGWELARDTAQKLVDGRDKVVLFGFSQGAILAATLAALAQRGEFPAPTGVILVAGGLPRAQLFQPWFEAPIATPSLHVWGERDDIARQRAPLLARHFVAENREIVSWPGPHVVPTRGLAADAIVAFIGRMAQAGTATALNSLRFSPER